MIQSAKMWALVCLGAAALVAVHAGAQNFGASKEKVTLQRKLPALVHLPGNSVKVTVTGAESDGALAYDFQALLETELLKDDPDLREDANPNTIITCRITQYSAPQVATSTGPSVALTKGAPKTQQFQRITGTMSVAFQAKTATGQNLISDNVNATYDEQFDSSGVSTSHGVMGSLSGSWGKLKGQKSEENTPPTTSELRSRLILNAVQQVAEHLVNTDEKLEVFLAKQNGALDEGDKNAQTGLWERALETFETATPDPKPEVDAYRLYDVGVAYEALAYQAEDSKAAMKYLDQAAINYGKAIDAKPAEKYFLEPQKRIETAIAHYKELQKEQEQAQQAKAAASEAAAAAPEAPVSQPDAAPKGLTNAQVVAMVKSGINDDTVIKTIHGAAAVSFDLSASGQKDLRTGGVSPRVMAAMKIQDAKAPKPAVHKGLTNAQVTAMVKAGMDEATVVQTIRTADAVDFDLTPQGQQALTSGGVSAHELTAMKARSMKKPTATASQAEE